MKYYTLVFVLFILLSACKKKQKSPIYSATANYPNIVYILADDLGYGDLQSYNIRSKISTPNIDQLAAEGMRFIDAHSPSGVCTPSRYGILTGRYCWRSRMPLGVLQGYGRSFIEKERQTLAELLRKRGYHTAVVGKWHLGLDWALNASEEEILKDEKTVVNEYGIISNMDPRLIDFGRNPDNGPTKHGFNYSFILPASLDMPPYCYLQNDRLEAIPDEETKGNDLNTNFTKAFWRPGRIANEFKFDEVLPTFIARAVSYIDNRAKQPGPFFLYLPLAAPHTPWMPTDQYKGTTRAGTYGDFVKMVDASVGVILEALSNHSLEENTLVVFTSDNGPYWRTDEIRKYGHRAAGNLRGMKADVWEGGHRVPFIVRWPVRIRPGVTKDIPISLTDFYATCADLLDEPLATNEAEDSQSLLPLLLDNPVSLSQRKAIIQQSSQGYFAIRQGNWKLITGLGSGGFSKPTQVQPNPGQAPGQLYNLREDISETNNLYQKYPEVVAELEAVLKEYQENGRTELKNVEPENLELQK